MRFFTKRFITAVILVVIASIALFLFVASKKSAPEPNADIQNFSPKRSVIGVSLEGREIEAYTYGKGEKHVAFVGGVHGGYEWNSVLLAYATIDYFDAHPEVIPANLKVTVIPSVNPDGVFKVILKEGRFAVSDVPKNTVPGRFNARAVDLNRNFDCNWKPKGTWRNATVSAGSEPFSEPESKAVRSFILKEKPNAAVFWHSQAGFVYTGECNQGILPETFDIANAYSKASGYPVDTSFDFYEVNGDITGWLSSINIPSITVELKTHESIEWERNLAGLKAILDYYERKGI